MKTIALTAIVSSYNPRTLMTSPDSLTDFELEIARFIVTALNLEVAPSEISPLEPLYGDGLGLDSIDVLEVALAVSKQYGFQMRSDDANNAAIFSSLRSLAAHIAANRA
jgi:acyl carrier protein